MTATLEMVPVESSNVAAIGHDAAANPSSAAMTRKMRRKKKKITNKTMNDIITQLQALATSDQAAVSAIPRTVLMRSTR